MIKNLIRLLVLVVLSINPSYSQTVNFLGKNVAPQRSVNGNYGCSVAINDTFLAIGAIGMGANDSNGVYHAEAGAVYVLKKDSLDNWQEHQVIFASDVFVGDRFGSSLAMFENTLVVSAPMKQLPGYAFPNEGAVYIFELDTLNKWTQTQRLISPNVEMEGEFGSSIDIHQNFLVVGAKNEDTDENDTNTLKNAGACYFYQKKHELWRFEKKLVPTKRNKWDQFGTSCAIYNSNIIVAANNDSNNVYVFNKKQNGWNQSQKIQFNPSDKNSRFLTSLDIDESQLVIGVPAEYSNVCPKNQGSILGKVYLFESDGFGLWNLDKVLQPLDVNCQKHFGASVKIQDKRLVVGSPSDYKGKKKQDSVASSGSIYLYEYANSVGWNEHKKISLTRREISDEFGAAVTMGDSFIIVGAIGEDMDINDSNYIQNSGAVYIYQIQTCNLIQNPIIQGDSIILHFSGDSIKFISCDPENKFELVTTKSSLKLSQFDSGSYYIVASGEDCSDTSDCFRIDRSIDSSMLPKVSFTYDDSYKCYPSGGHLTITAKVSGQFDSAVLEYTSNGNDWSVIKRFGNISDIQEYNWHLPKVDTIIYFETRIKASNSYGIGSVISDEASVIVPEATEFLLDSSGLSHIYWPFEIFESNWRNQNKWFCNHKEMGKGTNGHQCSDYFSLDYKKGEGKFITWKKGDWGLFDWIPNIVGESCDKDFYSPLSGHIIFIRKDIDWNCDNTSIGLANLVTIQSNIDTNFAFTITHLNEVNSSLDSGDFIPAQTHIGKIGATGHSWGPHAHCTLYKNINKKLNPIGPSQKVYTFKEYFLNKGVGNTCIPKTIGEKDKDFIDCVNSIICNNYQKAFASEFDFSAVLSTKNVKDVFGQKTIIYPNPANNFLVIGGIKNVEYIITDLRGRKILSGTFISDEKINISYLNQGVFILKIQDFISGKFYNHKFIKQ